MVFRILMTNGNSFVVGGLQGKKDDPEGYALLNDNGDIVGYIFTEEIVSITPEIGK